MMLVTLFAALALQVATPQAAPETTATPPAPAAAPRAPAARRAPDQVTCENRAPTGSTLRRQVCRSNQRAAADSRYAQDYLNDAQRGQATEPQSLGGPVTP